jgi:myo-inositol-1(or 4)-monophosphatase
MTPQDIADRRDCLEDAAREAGAIALRHFRHPETLNVKNKGLHDPVTVADRAVEDFLVKRIASNFPLDQIVGEEGGHRGFTGGASVRWFVDPIDGTNNFARGIPFWCTSIGLVVDGQLEAGIVYDAVTDEMFCATRGGGATCNGEPIRASAATAPEASRISLGLTIRDRVEYHHSAIERLLTAKCEYIRLGSAALSLAYIAHGRLEGYYSRQVMAWDVLGGIALVREAGGYVSDFMAGSGLESGNPILAAAPGVTTFLRGTLEGLEG